MVRPNACYFCRQCLSSKTKFTSQITEESPKEETKASSETEPLDGRGNKKDSDDLFGALKKQVEANGAGSDVIEKQFSRVQRISDIPKHELPVKDIVGIAT